MTTLSPAALAVWEAFNQDEAGVFVDYGDKLAAALRVAAAHLPNSAMYSSSDWGHGWRTGINDSRQGLLAIAAELEGAQ
jgi:hypothetical protein